MERVTGTVALLRRRVPGLDHTLDMLAHYSQVKAGNQAGGVTYFGFLSVFPILAVAFLVVGQIAHVYPDIQGQMTKEFNNLLPGVIGNGDGQIKVSDLGGSYTGWAGLIALAAVVYSGLGWLSGLRVALEVVFVVPSREQPNFVFGKLRDLATMALLGLILLVSVVLSGAVTGFTGDLLGLVGIDESAFLPALLLNVLGHALAIVATMVLLLTMFALLLEDTHVPRAAQVSGAALGAVGFEILKSAASLLLGSTKNSPAFQAFGISLILLVWIYYFSRLVLYAAAWAYSAPSALAQRQAEATRAPASTIDAADDVPVQAARSTTVAEAPSRTLRLAGLAAAAGALTAWLLRGPRA